MPPTIQEAFSTVPYLANRMAKVANEQSARAADDYEASARASRQQQREIRINSEIARLNDEVVAILTELQQVYFPNLTLAINRDGRFFRSKNHIWALGSEWSIPASLRSRIEAFHNAEKTIFAPYLSVGIQFNESGEAASFVCRYSYRSLNSANESSLSRTRTCAVSGDALIQTIKELLTPNEILADVEQYHQGIMELLTEIAGSEEATVLATSFLDLMANKIEAPSLGENMVEFSGLVKQALADPAFDIETSNLELGEWVIKAHLGTTTAEYLERSFPREFKEKIIRVRILYDEKGQPKHFMCTSFVIPEKPYYSSLGVADEFETQVCDLDLSALKELVQTMIALSQAELDNRAAKKQEKRSFKDRLLGR